MPWLTDARYCIKCAWDSATQQEGIETYAPVSNGNTMQCPFCSEEILATAKKCKHCGEWLGGPPPRVLQAGIPQAGSADARAVSKGIKLHEQARAKLGVMGCLGYIVGCVVFGIAMQYTGSFLFAGIAGVVVFLVIVVAAGQSYHKE